MSTLLAALVYMAGCQSGPYRTVKTPQFVCEIPKDWKVDDMQGPELWADAPEDLEHVRPRLTVYRLGVPHPREYIEKLKRAEREESEGDANFSQEELREMVVMGVEGLSYSETALNSRAVDVALHKGLPVPQPVLYKETYLYFSVPAGPFRVTYAAPVQLYEKYRPAFDHLIQTLRLRS